jgi:Membrane-bound metallopeptidase
MLAPILAPASSPAPSASARAAQTREQLQQIRQRIKRVTAGIASASEQRDQRRAALHEAEQAAVAARQKLRDLDRKLQQAEQQAAALDKRSAQAQQRLDAARERLSRSLRSAYEMRRPSPLMLLLQGEDPARALRLGAYYDALAQSRLQAIDAVQKQAAEVAKLQAEAQARRKALAAARADQQAQAGQLRERQAARATALADVDAHLSSQKQRLERLKSSEVQVEKLLADLARALAQTPYQAGNAGPFAKLRGHLPWPVRGPLLARFGQAKADGRLHWRGVWIGAPSGTPVRAVARGRVAYVGWLTRYGLVVVLQHDHGYFTIYGHNALATVHTGDTVHAGQEIAEAGDTGGYRRSGVYLEVRHNTQALNPGDWLAH